jgi:hypothetical protein
VVIDHGSPPTITDVVVRASYRTVVMPIARSATSVRRITDVSGRPTHAEVPEGARRRRSGLVPPHLVRERPSVEAAEEAEALKDAAVWSRA